MRYQYMSYRVAVSTHRLEPWRMVVEPTRWRPAADVFESAEGLTLTIDLAGVDEEHAEILLFENALIVQGRRELPAPPEDAIFHAAEIRHGPFRLEISVPGDLDHERVDATLERGLLTVRLPRVVGR